jgi:hypothetical protein
MSEQEMQWEGKPLPCIICDKQLDSAANDPAFDRVPYGGTIFYTNGHYGSTVFDSLDGELLEIVICDKCLVERRKGRVVIIGSTGIPMQCTEYDA